MRNSALGKTRGPSARFCKGRARAKRGSARRVRPEFERWRGRPAAVPSAAEPCAAVPSQTVLKEGDLLKQTSSFQRWKRRYFKLRGRTLYYAQNAKVSARSLAAASLRPRGPFVTWLVAPQSIIFDEVDLTDASVAESSTKNVNNSFTVDAARPSVNRKPRREGAVEGALKQKP